jgi:pimeloyl-ACP methyl ester carboxylesterase
MDVSAEIKQVQCPALLIWGRQDRLVPPDIADTLRKVMPASRLQIIDGAGHVVMFDQPAAFNDAVLRFLSGEVVGT